MLYKLNITTKLYIFLHKIQNLIILKTNINFKISYYTLLFFKAKTITKKIFLFNKSLTFTFSLVNKPLRATFLNELTLL